MIRNYTPFSATSFSALDKDGATHSVTVLEATFDLPRPGTSLREPLRMSDEQPEPSLVEAFRGAPEDSSLERPDELIHRRPGAEVTLVGHARSSGNEPALAVPVRVRVGPVSASMRVVGDRVWQRRLGGLSPSRPIPFTHMPLTWERAMGAASGSDAPRNPVGMGVYAAERDARDRPLANLERAGAPAARISDRAEPWCFAPIPRHWHPRAKWAGTYDDRWIAERAPIPPHDFDERFYFSAPDALRSASPFEGGMLVRLEGLHPDGVIECELPRCQLVVEARLGGAFVGRTPSIDAVRIDTDRQRIGLVYRTAIQTPARSMGVRGAEARLLSTDARLS